MHVFGLDRKQDRVDVLGLWIENDSLKKKKKKSKPVETCQWCRKIYSLSSLWKIEISLECVETEVVGRDFFF